MPAIRITLFDDAGLVIETRTVTAKDAAALAYEFVMTQGADIDGDGELARSGRIEFSPVD